MSVGSIKIKNVTNQMKAIEQTYLLFVMQYQMVILLASPPLKNKQTNKQNKQAERKSTGAPQQLWPITAARIIIMKKNSDTRKTTVTCNKLFDETRDKHYYILNR